MQPSVNSEPKEAEKIVQQQVAEPTGEVKKEELESPKIKSEENKNNWAAFRAQREAERKAKEESDRRAAEKAAEAEALKKALEAVTSKPAQQSNQYDYSYATQEETEEQRIEKKVHEALQKERQRMEEEMRKREIQETPMRLQQQFPDFNSVMTTENIDYFEYHHPDLASPYRYMPDGYEKWSMLYKAMKKMIPNPNSTNDQKKIEKNLNKPGSISATGNTVGSESMPSARLTEDRKRQNWERMQRTLSGLS